MFKMSRKVLLSVCLVFTLVFMVTGSSYSAPAASQVQVGSDGKLLPLPNGFPDSTLTLANVFPPEHPEAIHARMMADLIAKYSPVTVVSTSMSAIPTAHFQAWRETENLPGGVEGYRNYTISWSGMVSRILTGESMGYTPEEAAETAILVTGVEPSLLVVRADAPWNTFEELVEYAKANPGKLRIAPSNTGSGYHIGMVLLGVEAGFEWTHVPTDGQGEAYLLMLGGGAEATIANTTGAKGLVEEGKAKILLQFIDKRSSAWPDVPSTGEKGFSSFPRTAGFCAQPGVPAEARAWLVELFYKGYNDPVYQQYLVRNGYEPIGLRGQEAVDYVNGIIKMVTPIVRDLGLLKPELQ